MRKTHCRQPIISVVIPIHNVEQYLTDCLESLQKQSFKNFEAILVDDGSTDSCPEICDLFSQKDSRFITIHTPNRGVSSARNLALKISHAPYIVFVDSDDIVSPIYLSSLYQALVESKSDVLICGYTKFSKSDDLEPLMRSLKSYSPKLLDCVKNISTEEFRNSIFSLKTNTSNLPTGGYCFNKIFNKKILDGIFFPALTAAEDEFFLFQVTQKTIKIGLLPISLYYYRQRNTSAVYQDDFGIKLWFTRKQILNMCIKQNWETETIETALYQHCITALIDCFISPKKFYVYFPTMQKEYKSTFLLTKYSPNVEKLRPKIRRFRSVLIIYHLPKFLGMKIIKICRNCFFLPLLWRKVIQRQ